MPNVFKSGNTATNGSIYKGQFTIGVNTTVGFGPTSETSFWNGIVPDAGGYTIHQNKAANGPSIRTAADDSALVTTMLSLGSTGSTAAQVLNWASQQSDIMVANRDYESIVTSGMVLCVDAGYVSSYPTTANAWRDLSGNNYTGTLTNGPTFSSANGGSIVFDGVNDFVVTNNITLSYTGYTMECAVKYNSVSGNQGLFNYSQSGAGKYINLYKANASVMRWETNNGQSIVGTNNLTTGVWYLFSGVYDGTTAYLYRNGSLEASGALTSHTSQTATFDIGTYAGYTNGSIAFARFYTRALSTTEILQNYNALKGRFGL